jgi:hypothetical protein
LTRPEPAWAARSVFQTEGERIMITLEQHIHELQAELRGCWMTPRERAEIEVELEKAIAQQVEIDNEFDNGLAAEIRGKGG